MTTFKKLYLTVISIVIMTAAPLARAEKGTQEPVSYLGVKFYRPLITREAAGQRVVRGLSNPYNPAPASS